MSPQDEHTTAASPDATSYWEAPPEATLQGKTLSTLNMTDLTHERVAEAPAARNNYWDWQESIRKSLSKLTLTDLFFQQQQQQSSSEVAKEDEKDKADDDNNAATKNDSTTTPPSAVATTTSSPAPSYWSWRNASFSNLRASTASLTALEQASQQADQEQAVAGSSTAAATATTKPTGSYWFWRNPATTDSTASLDTLEQTAREADRMTGTTAAGPISNLSHRLRNSWRQSFHKLSSQSLTKLNEAGHENETATSDGSSNGNSNTAEKSTTTKQQWKEGLQESRRRASVHEFVQEEGDDNDDDADNDDEVGGAIFAQFAAAQQQPSRDLSDSIQSEGGIEF